MTGGASPSRRAGTVEGAGGNIFGGDVTSATVEARRCGAHVVHHLAIGSGESFRTHAHVLVGILVDARGAVLARLMSPARIQICKKK